MSTTEQTRVTHDGRVFRVEVTSRQTKSGQTVDLEVVRHPGAALIVPVLDDGRIALIQNHRPAVEQTLWELPAGKLETEESPETAAARELEEETGYRPGLVQKLGEYYTSPGMSDELMHVYLATGLEMVGQALQDDEEIEVGLLTLEQANQMVADGTIRDGKTIAALYLWQLHAWTS